MDHIEMDTRLTAASVAATSELSEILQQEVEVDGNPRLLVRKAILMQVSDSDFTDAEIRSALNRALTLDPQCVSAYVELGWFKLTVENDPHGAKEVFLQGKTILDRLHEEIMQGLNDCNED